MPEIINPQHPSLTALADLQSQNAAENATQDAATGEESHNPEEIAIVVVDSARFSSTIIAKILGTCGYQDVRYTNSPFQALRSLEKRSADVLIADANMPSMNGLELARRVRTTEPTNKHHTHIILLTVKEDPADLAEALKAGVDDFLSKDQIRNLLPSRVMAAHHMAQRQNALLKENAGLHKQIGDLRTTDIIDPITGLGNLTFTLARIDDLSRDVEARGGATCLLLVGINNLGVISNTHDTESVDELVSGFAAKVRNLVRPLDVVTRPEPGIIAVCMRQPSLENCTSRSFKRIFDNLYMHSFKTGGGYIPVVVGVGVCIADNTTGLPGAKNYLRAAYNVLMRSYETGIVTVSEYSPEQAEPHLSLWA